MFRQLLVIPLFTESKSKQKQASYHKFCLGRTKCQIEASPCLNGAPFPFTTRTPGPIMTPNSSNFSAQSPGSTRTDQSLNDLSAISLKPAVGNKCMDFVDRGVGHVESEMGLPQTRGKENSSTRGGDVPLNLQQTFYPHPQGQFLPQGWLYNWGSIYCWSCQSYGFLLQPMQV